MDKPPSSKHRELLRCALAGTGIFPPRGREERLLRNQPRLSGSPGATAASSAGRMEHHGGPRDVGTALLAGKPSHIPTQACRGNEKLGMGGKNGFHTTGSQEQTKPAPATGFKIT